MKKQLLNFALLLVCLVPALVGCRRGALVRHDQLGVQTHYGHKGWEPLSTLDSISDLGVGWIRDDLLWSSVEREKGKYRIPDHTWEWVLAARKHDLKIILILNGGNGLYKDPYDHDGYVNFARFVAREMKGQVQALELINEPFGHFRKAAVKTMDKPGRWNGWDSEKQTIAPWVKKYVETMNGMADAIAAEAPGAYKIIGLGCSPPLNKHMLNHGVSKNIDGIVLHPYSYRMPPEWVPYGDTPHYRKRDGIAVGDEHGNLIAINADLLQTAAKHDGPGEIWLTEQGYTTFQPRVNGSSYEGYTEEAQAIYAQRRFMECLGTGVRLASWYNFYCKKDKRDDSEGNFGIIRRDGAPKPAYHAIQRVARTMVAWEPAAWGTVSVVFAPDRPRNWPPRPSVEVAGREEVRTYLFRHKHDDDVRSVAIWSTEPAGGDMLPRSARVTIETPCRIRKIKAVDMMTGLSKPVKFVRTERTLTIEKLTVPGHPVLLILE